MRVINPRLSSLISLDLSCNFGFVRILPDGNIEN